MKRLTKGYLSGNYSAIKQKCDCLTSAELGFYEAINKLGELEDTEEKLSINLKLLPTLLKIKKGDKIYVIDGTLVEAEVTDNSLVNGELMVFAHYPHKDIMYTPVCYYSKYGKTWALTKEELL